MKKSRQKSFLYEVPIYKTSVLFIFYNNHKYANKILNKNGYVQTIIDEGDRGAQGWENIITENNDEIKRFYLVIHNGDRKESTLVHELLHLTQDILEHHGIKFRKGAANEPFTHLQEQMYTDFLPHIK